MSERIAGSHEGKGGGARAPGAGRGEIGAGIAVAGVSDLCDTGAGGAAAISQTGSGGAALSDTGSSQRSERGVEGGSERGGSRGSETGGRCELEREVNAQQAGRGLGVVKLCGQGGGGLSERELRALQGALERGQSVQGALERGHSAVKSPNGLSELAAGDGWPMPGGPVQVPPPVAFPPTLTGGGQGFTGSETVGSERGGLIRDLLAASVEDGERGGYMRDVEDGTRGGCMGVVSVPASFKISSPTRDLSVRASCKMPWHGPERPPPEGIRVELPPGPPIAELLVPFSPSGSTLTSIFPVCVCVCLCVDHALRLRAGSA